MEEDREIHVLGSFNEGSSRHWICSLCLRTETRPTTETSCISLSRQCCGYNTCQLVIALHTLNRDKTSGLLRDAMEFDDRSSSRRVAAAAGLRLDSGRSGNWLWASASRSIPPSLKSASGRERSLL